MCVEVAGAPTKINAFIDVMQPLGIVEMCRTGAVALERGSEVLVK
jgi:acetolactate synthase-1/3 small subunit